MNTKQVVLTARRKRLRYSKVYPLTMSEKIFSHFNERLPEWIIALAIGLWGIPLLLNPELFASSFYFIGLSNLFDQATWGFIALFICILRLTFLTINGAWRKSAHLRALGAIMSVVFWVVVYMSYAVTEFLIPGLALIFAAIIFDFHSIWVAAGDAKKSDIKSKLNDFTKDPA